MIKYSYIKLTGCLVAAALAPLCTSAQRINTEASVERLKSESLQFSYSDNASGISSTRWTTTARSDWDTILRKVRSNGRRRGNTTPGTASSPTAAAR